MSYAVEAVVWLIYTATTIPALRVGYQGIKALVLPTSH